MVERVVVVGAGIAGLAATLAFARRGLAVTLVERDPATPPPTAEESFLDWDRPGVPQRRLVHGFLPLARQLLIANLPDVVDRLLEAGAHEVDALAHVTARERRPGDEDLFVLRSRRTVFEWVLRREVAREGRARVVTGDRVAGLLGDAHAVTGVGLRSGRTLNAHLVIDAAGRSSGVSGWLAALGATAPGEESAACDLVYFSRFYRHRAEVFPVAHQAVLGYANAAAAGADGRTFSLTFFARAEERGLRRLRDEAAFERAVASIPGFEPWRAEASPLGGVNAMGSLENSIRRFSGDAVVAGLVPIGDSLSHTNPNLGRGMSLGLGHAFTAAAIDWETLGSELGVAEYLARVKPMTEASFANAVAGDDVRRHLFAGDPTAAESPLGLIIRAAAHAAADQDLARALVRSNGLLEDPGWILAEPWLARARSLLANPPAHSSAGPDLQEMLAILGAPD